MRGGLIKCVCPPLCTVVGHHSAKLVSGGCQTLGSFGPVQKRIPLRWLWAVTPAYSCCWLETPLTTVIARRGDIRRESLRISARFPFVSAPLEERRQQSLQSSTKSRLRGASALYKLEQRFIKGAADREGPHSPSPGEGICEARRIPSSAPLLYKRQHLCFYLRFGQRNFEAHPAQVTLQRPLNALPGQSALTPWIVPQVYAFARRPVRT